MILSPVYWSVDALHDYYAKGLIGNLPLRNDVGFKKLKNGGITITLKTLGIKFSIPEFLVLFSFKILVKNLKIIEIEMKLWKLMT